VDGINQRLPTTVTEVQLRWALTLDAPSKQVLRVDRTAIARGFAAQSLKVGMPHMKQSKRLPACASERRSDGAPDRRRRRAQRDAAERCAPGTLLRTRPEEEQDVVIAGLLKRM
jgi:hypothetical protein